MKKTTIFILIFILSTFTACDSQNSIKNDSKSIGLVCGYSNVSDNTYNESIWRGIELYAKENQIPKSNYRFINTMKENEHISSLSRFSDEKCDLIIAPGYKFGEAMRAVSKKYPKQKFLLIDDYANADNLYTINFAANEGSYLVGIVAALKAKELNSNKIGFIGGIDAPLIQSFEAGFEAGIKEIDPNIELTVKFTDEFSSVIKGKECAKSLYDDDFKIIFSVCGKTGMGIIEEAKQRAMSGDEVWVIGVDKDQYQDGVFDGGKSVILTSMVKNLDKVTMDAIDSIFKNEFEGRSKLYTLKNKGIGLPKINPNLDKKTISIIEEYKEKIINDEIVVPNLPKRLQNKN